MKAPTRAVSAGSSPLSRGILAGTGLNSWAERIIPALAGNTMLTTPEGVLQTDHPRSRGEYSRICRSWRSRCGSSPLSRGILWHRGDGLAGNGIIPALAGNTGSELLPRNPGTDHPRSRGEYEFQQGPVMWTLGSSPLSRGILTLHRALVTRPRIIPALAGNTVGCLVRAAACPDHPRSRGEYLIAVVRRVLPSGSSPLSRGIRPPPGHRQRPLRIIPALAGNTTRYPG